MQKNEWNPVKAAMIGAAISPLMLVAQIAMDPAKAPPSDPAGYVGFVIGGILGGAVLGWIVAAVRNRAAR